MDTILKRKHPRTTPDHLGLIWFQWRRFQYDFLSKSAMAALRGDIRFRCLKQFFLVQNINFFNFLLLLYYKSKSSQFLTVGTWQHVV
jgi:hypothetical protein